MQIELTDDNLEKALQGAVQKGFEAAFSDWNFTREVNQQVADMIAKKEIASKIGVHINKLLEEKHEEIITSAVSKILPTFEKSFEMAINQTVRRMLIGMHLNVDAQYKSDELQRAIKLVDNVA
jgi:hypothetical protein